MHRIHALIVAVFLLFASSLSAFVPSTPAAITSPAPGSKLASASATFVWTAGAGATAYSLYIGTTSGAHDIAFVNTGAATSATVNNLPTNGGTFYVRLNSLVSGSWQSTTYSYIAAGIGTAATMTSPAPGTKLTSATATFVWTAGAGVTSYSLYIGTTAGAHDLGFISTGAATSTTVNNLPTNGGTFYVKLNSLIGASWQSKSYTYIASGTGTAATMTSPAPSSTLTSSTVTFVWTAGAGVSAYSLYIGTTSGAHDIAFVNAGTATTKTVTGLPVNGGTFYVTLNSLIGALWHANTYHYIASGTGTPAVMTSPSPGSTLPSTSATFVWTTGAGVTAYSLYIGTTAGAHDIAFFNMGTATSKSVTGLPNNGNKFYVTLNSLIGASWHANTYTYTATGVAMAFTTSQGDLDNGLLNNPYSALFHVSGGVPPYSFSIASGSTPAGVPLSNVVDGGLLLGTPTKAGTYTFAVKATDHAGNSVTSSNFAILISNPPDGKHNSYINGRYVCSLEFYIDSDASRYGSLASIAVDGAGHITSGVYDTTGRTVGVVTGTLTGTYNLGADNNGTFTILANDGISTKTTNFALMANNPAGPSSSSLQFVEIDDLGSVPAGKHGGGSCTKATTAAFNGTTLTGSSFVFVSHGENGSGAPKAIAGRFTTNAGAISNGVADQFKGSDSPANIPFTGSYAAPDSTTGRFTFTILTPGGGSLRVGYIVDANRLLMISADDGGAEVGEIYKQHQTSYTAANLNGAFVLHHQKWEMDVSATVQRFLSEVAQGMGDGMKNLTINQSYTDEAENNPGTGIYTVGDGDGTVSFTMTPNGRVVLNTGGGEPTLVYLYDNNAGVTVGGGLNSGSGYYTVDFGYVEPQSLKTFTDSAIAGTYLGTNMPRIEPNSGESILQVTLNTSGSVIGIEDDGGMGWMGYLNPINATYSWTSTTFGTIVVSQSGQQILSCVAISTTRFACIEDTSNDPKVLLMQQ